MPSAEASSVRRPAAPLPLSVLTGFLGAGKTTLLQRLLRDPGLADTAVIINEIGEIGLDHLLVETIEGGVSLLKSGCLCCSLRGDLVDTLETLLRSLDNGRLRFRRVMVETTGLADPAPVLQTIMLHPYLVMRYRLDGVICMVDAVHGLTTLDQHAESVKQAAVADRLVLSKTDCLASADERTGLARLRARLAAINPSAPLLDAAAGEADAARLLDCGLYDPARKTADVRRWLGEVDAQAPDHHGHHQHQHHDDRIRNFAITTEAAIPAAVLDMFLELLRATHGTKLLRLKGIVKLAETPETPVVVHGVQHALHPLATLPAWPDDDRRTRLVFIVSDLDPRQIRELFDAFIGVPAPDRPDRAALLDNPLVPFGG
jgi:G3E family GTPase